MVAGLLISGVALVAAAAVIHSLHHAWQQCSARELGDVLDAGSRKRSADVEATIVAHLLSGRISGENYRDVAAALAAAEPQPHGLQRIV